MKTATHPAPACPKIFLARFIIPADPPGLVLHEHGLCVSAEGRIVELAKQSELRRKYPDAEITDLGDRIVLPGFVNCHVHAAMSLMRGLANDMPLLPWLEQIIWPAESRCLNPEFVRCGTELAIAEMLQSGTTCFNDMYLFPEQAALAAEQYGIRAVIGLPVTDFPTPWAQSPKQGLELAGRLLEKWRGRDRILFTLAPHAPYTISDNTFRALLRWHQLTDERMLIQTHLHESADELTKSVSQYRLRPINRLEQLGVLERPLLAIHMTQVSDADIELCRRQKVSIAHCPRSNAHFGHGIAPVTRMRDGGLRVGLGTDGAASNNSLSLYHEMTLAPLLAKLDTGRADALSAADALRMATMGGAEALGLSEHIGSLEVGKCADFQAIELTGWGAEPVIDVLRQIVYAPSAYTVSDVFVGGQPLVTGGQVLGAAGTDLKSRVQTWSATVKR